MQRHCDVRPQGATEDIKLNFGLSSEPVFSLQICARLFAELKCFSKSLRNVRTHGSESAPGQQTAELCASCVLSTQEFIFCHSSQVV